MDAVDILTLEGLHIGEAELSAFLEQGLLVGERTALSGAFVFSTRSHRPTNALAGVLSVSLVAGHLLLVRAAATDDSDRSSA